MNNSPKLLRVPTAILGFTLKKICSVAGITRSNSNFKPKDSRPFAFTLKPIFLTSTLLGIPSATPAAIDSGGGKSSGDTNHNHSSMGGSFASTTRENPVLNHPGLIEVIYPVTPSSVTDVNENGLPDGWEIQCFGHLGADSSADADHDGTSNLLEYQAGTNPNNARSVFRPQGAYTGGSFQMPVPTVSGRNYLVWVSRDLLSWTLQSTLTGDNSEQLFEFDETTITAGPLQSSNHPSNYFFRVQILVSPTP